MTTISIIYKKNRRKTFEIFLYLIDLQYVIIKDEKGKEDWFQITKKKVKVVDGNPSIESKFFLTIIVAIFK